MSALKPIEWVEDANGCWNCTSHYKNRGGYPSKYRKALARFMYEECFGMIPKGKLVRHKCDNRSCINPEHLELGTYEDNHNDKKRHGTWQSGERDGFHKLTLEQVDEIRRTYRWGMAPAMAGKYGVTKSAIQRIVNGTRWNMDNHGRMVV